MERLSKRLKVLLGETGISVRGAVSFASGEGPSLEKGGHARTVILLGNEGGSVWAAFSNWRTSQADGGGEDPLDRWSEEVILPIADALGATAYFPSRRPYQPFQQWAKAAESLHSSPLGILIHPRLGLWHGYRAALGLSEAYDVSVPDAVSSVCETCLEKPCLSACPVDAVSDDRFDVPKCRDYLKTSAGQTGCMVAGCAARNACPEAVQYRYSDEQLRFHMDAFSG